MLTSGNADGSYCSPHGRIGRFEAGSVEKTVAYLDEGWSGLPPSDHCSVYRVDGPPGPGYYEFVTSEGDPPTAEELVRRDPAPQLLTEGNYPGGGAYLWIFIALLLPPALWGLAVSLRGAATRSWR